MESYEAAPLGGDRASGAPCYLLPLSAKTPQALAQRVADLAAYLQGKVTDTAEATAPTLRAVSYTLLCTRHHFAHRAALARRGPMASATSLTRTD